MSDWREQAKAAIEEALGHGYSSLDNFLGALVDAVEPIIRADEREKAAQRIEALMLDPKDHCIEEYNAGLANAARAARGEQP